VDFRILTGSIGNIRIESGEILIDLKNLVEKIQGRHLDSKFKSLGINSETYTIESSGENRLCISQAALGLNIVLVKPPKKE
jgi:hypothetical protein